MASSTHRIRIHAKPEAVFQAISTEQGMKGWYTANVEGSFSQEGTSIFRFPNGESFEWKTTKLVPGKEVERECVSGQARPKAPRSSGRSMARVRTKRS